MQASAASIWPSPLSQVLLPGLLLWGQSTLPLTFLVHPGADDSFLNANLAQRAGLPTIRGVWAVTPHACIWFYRLRLQVMKGPDLSRLPACYHTICAVFSNASTVPPRCPYDWAIDLLPGAPLPPSQFYSLLKSEREANYRVPKQGFPTSLICLSSSVVGAGFFFREEERGIPVGMHRLHGAK